MWIVSKHHGFLEKLVVFELLSWLLYLWGWVNAKMIVMMGCDVACLDRRRGDV